MDSVDRILGTGDYEGRSARKGSLEGTTKTTLDSEIVSGRGGQNNAIRMTERTENYQDGTVNIELKVHDTFPDVTGQHSEITQRYHQEKTTATVEPDGQVAKVTIHHSEDTGELTNSLVEKESLSRTHNHQKLEENVADYNEQLNTTEVDLYQKDKSRGEAKKVFSTGYEVLSQERTVWEHSRSRSRSGERIKSKPIICAEDTEMAEKATTAIQGDNVTQPAVLIETTNYVTKAEMAQVVHLYGTPCEKIVKPDETKNVWRAEFADDKSASLFLYAMQKELFRHPGFLNAYHDHAKALDTDGPSKRGRSRERRRDDYSDGVRSRSRSRSAENKMTNVERVNWTEGVGSSKKHSRLDS